MEIKRKPDWLRIRIRNGKNLNKVSELLESLSLNTVCKEANCPNRMECFDKKTATFMILGKVCSRSCRFCNIKGGVCDPVDVSEPESISEAVKILALQHVVITSVTRDDLSDGGAFHFADVINMLKKSNAGVRIEVLIPDFQGRMKSLLKVTDAFPDIINHNVETVPSLYKVIRSGAEYERSLGLLCAVKEINPDIRTKSGIMLGLGEKEEEVLGVLNDLAAAACDGVTIGQYLAPSKEHHPVVEYIRPEMFEYYKKKAMDMGLKYVASAPFVRSSYNAAEMF